jgi:hypothetical protein
MIKTLFSKPKTIECYFTPNDFKKAIICLAGIRAVPDVDRGIGDYVEFSYSLESMVPQRSLE